MRPNRKNDRAELFDRIIGLGERSARKTWFPELERRMEELERLRTLLDQTQDMVFIIACDEATFIDVNATACRILGYEREELLKTAPTIIFGSGIAQEILSGGCASGTGISATSSVFSRQHAIPVEITATMTRMRGLGYALVLARDISQRLAAEETERRILREIDEARSLLQVTIDTAPVAVAYLDREQRYILANRPYTEHLAVTMNDLAGKTIREVLGEEDYAGIREAVTEALAGSFRSVHIERIHRTSGENRFFVAYYAPHLSQGTVAGVVIALSDITDLKLAEIELRRHAAEALRSRDRLQAIIDSTPLPIAYIDPEERYLFVNTAYAEMLAQPKEEIVGRVMQDVLSEENYRQICDHATAAARGESQRFSLEWVGATEPRYYIKRCAPDIDSSGTIHGIVSTLNDVTDLKETEREVVAAKEAAEAANRAKSEFLANMSHEMRTPLAGVLGMINLVMEMPLQEEQRTLLEVARSSGESLLRLIQDILEFARLEAGPLQFENRPFAVRECVETALAVVAQQAGEKGLALERTIAEEVPSRLCGDERRLRQVLVNLLGNAVKFTPAGKVSVTLRMQDDSRVLFCVEDTGIGIASDKIPRLFHRFTQIDASSTRKYGGTGLGLALSSEIVKKMGGTMWAESEPGRGSRFWFTVPVGEEE